MAILRAGDGSDGDVTISSNKNINTDIIAGGRSYADGVFFRVTTIGSNYATVDATPNGLVSGDSIIIINVMGRSGNYDNAGNYEIFTVDYISSNDIYFTQPVNKFYGDNGSNGNMSLHPAMLQRIPNYNSVTIDSGATLSSSDCPNGNNSIGGMIVFKCAETLNIINGYIESDGGGYWGGVTFAAGGTGRGRGANWGYYGSGAGYGTAGIAAPSAAGGIAYGVADLSKMMHASGGGAGQYSSWTQVGGDGGGIVFIMALTITISSGYIGAKGLKGGGPDMQNGGGGSGGSVLLHAGIVTLPNGSVAATKGLKGGGSAGNGGDGIAAIYYQAGSIGTMDPIPYTDTIETPYKISGTIINGPAQYLRIYDIDSGELLNTYSGIANGAYEVDAPGSGPYDVITRKSDGNMLAYGEVMPVEI
jgi:hypothetical protein